MSEIPTTPAPETPQQAKIRREGYWHITGRDRVTYFSAEPPFIQGSVFLFFEVEDKFHAAVIDPAAIRAPVGKEIPKDMFRRYRG